MEPELKLSNQAIGAVMMALQKSLAEQSDIVETLLAFNFKDTEDGLMILNPPIFNMESVFGNEERS